jgi:hypothetical protein
MEVGSSWPKVDQRICGNPYLKNKLKKKELGHGSCSTEFGQ